MLSIKVSSGNGVRRVRIARPANLCQLIASLHRTLGTTSESAPDYTRITYCGLNGDQLPLKTNMDLDAALRQVYRSRTQLLRLRVPNRSAVATHGNTNGGVCMINNTTRKGVFLTLMQQPSSSTHRLTPLTPLTPLVHSDNNNNNNNKDATNRNLQSCFIKMTPAVGDANATAPRQGAQLRRMRRSCADASRSTVAARRDGRSCTISNATRRGVFTQGLSPVTPLIHHNNDNNVESGHLQSCFVKTSPASPDTSGDEHIMAMRQGALLRRMARKRCTAAPAVSSEERRAQRRTTPLQHNMVFMTPFGIMRSARHMKKGCNSNTEDHPRAPSSPVNARMSIEVCAAQPAQEKSTLLQNLATLESFGFTNKKRNVELLVKHRNELGATVQELVE